jgi:DNA ligase-associated metallophosphoesterase
MPRHDALAITLADTPIVLYAERAVGIPSHGALLIADLHLGKAMTLRAHGVPVPPGGTRADLARLDAVIARSAASHLYVLGDLVHSRLAWHPRALAPFAAWRATHPTLAITLVRGNHDAHGGDPPAALDIDVVTPPHPLPPFALQHEPPEDGMAPLPSIFGHLHPSLAIAGRGRQRVRLPCFVRRGVSLLLPAFTAFTGGGAWQPAPGDDPYLVAGDEIVPVAPISP